MNDDKAITSLADVKLPTPEELGVASIDDEGEPATSPTSKEETKSTDEGETKTPSVEPVQEEVTYTDIELQAMDRGWTPKEQFKGDPASWRPADIYVEQGLLMDKVSSSNKKVSQLQQAVDNMTIMIEKQSKMALSKEKNELMEHRRNAIADSDVETVELYDERIKQLETPSAQQAPAPIPSPAVHDFLYQNTDWFNKDTRENEDMREFAIKTGIRLAQNYPSFTETEQLTKVKEAVVKAYPHRFNVRTPVPRKVAQQKVEGASQHREVKSKGITFKDLPPDLKNMVNNIWIASNKRISRDKYAQELERTGAISYE